MNVPVCLALAVALLAGTAAPGASLAQTPEPEAAAQLDDVVVLARRSGAPMWTVRRGDSTLILVGSITGIPRDLPWRPDDLEAAAAQADTILTPQVGQASVTDLLRVIWRARTLALMPEGKTSADFLEPEWQARLEAVMADERNDQWRRRSFLFLSDDLMSDKAGFLGRGGADDALEVVRRAARRARVPVRPIGVVRGDELIDDLLNAPQSRHAPCIQSTIEAAEAGPEATRARAEAWRRLRVAEVVNSPIDRALDRCWPWGDPEIAPMLRTQWADAVQDALTRPGVTLAVSHLRLLGETGGVLDQLEARGLEIEGPDWRPVVD